MVARSSSKGDLGDRETPFVATTAMPGALVVARHALTIRAGSVGDRGIPGGYPGAMGHHDGEATDRDRLRERGDIMVSGSIAIGSALTRDEVRTLLGQTCGS
jgi:hypothetical protein